MLTNAFEGLSTEESLQLAAYALMAILEKMPRTDTADRVIVQASESTTPVTVSSGTVTTVTTATNVTNVNNFAGGNTALLPYQFSIGALGPLYDNLVIS